VNCANCRAALPEDAVFCGHCGNPLQAMRTCARCGRGNPAGLRFCLGCGQPVSSVAAASAPQPRSYTPKHLAEKILTSRNALEGERKQVTVLFADVKGSMDLAEQVDPEEWHRIMDRFFAILSEGVHRLEGTINQFTGDGVIALFGAPIAHEDHAERTCYAALHLRDELRPYADELRIGRGLNFSVRMGINSGEVIVGKIGEDLRMDYTAQGHTVGLAARMEQLAEAGRIYLTEHTAKLVGGYFALRDLGASSIKGVSEPLHVFELEGVVSLRTRLDVSRARGFSRFVGRQEEMATLEAALTRTLAGQGQVVGVVAAAGTGKSRVCTEFTGRCRARGIRVAEAHCPSIGKNVPFLPLLALLRELFDIAESDGAHEARRKIAGELMLSGQDLQWVVPLVFDFLGVRDPDRPLPAMDADERKAKLLASVRHLVQARSAREPLLIFVDDTHWIDSGSDEFLAQVVEAAGGTRTLVLVNFRPEYHAEWTAKSYYRQIPLGPLGREASRELVEDLIGRHPSVASLPGLIHQRTGGNPFFTEEVARSLVESGALEGSRGDYRLVRPLAGLKVPATVQAVLAARIDRLAERERGLLQTAALIGKEFPRSILERVANLAPGDLSGGLAGLEHAEFIFERALYPEAEYAFRHPLTQEVALQSQLSERRKRLHAAIAQAIEALRPDRLDEEEGALAHHWEEAGEALRAARWHGRAAHRTEDTDPSESLRRWQKVRALLADATVSAETTSLRMQACRGILAAHWRIGGSEVDSVFAEGKALAEQTGDLRLLAILFNQYGNAKGVAGDLRAYHKLAVEALRVAERTNDPAFQAEIACDAHTFSWTGQLQEAVRLTNKAITLGPEDLSLGQELFGASAYLMGLAFRGGTLVEMGRFDEAASDLDRASQHPAEQPSAFVYSQAYHVVRAYRSGDVSGALTHARRVLDGTGPTPLQVFAQLALGIALLASGDRKEAEKAERRALALARKSGLHYGLTAWAICFLAEAKLGQGDTRAALELADEALADARQSGGRLFEMDALLTRARALLGSEGARCAPEVERTLAEVSALIDETEARCREPIVHEISAELARLRGDKATRERELREAHRLFTDMGATGHAERIAPLLAEPAR
jgi:class 3 adenylate cyclase/tetratricopeptide (TPR) repeat protein